MLLKLSIRQKAKPIGSLISFHFAKKFHPSGSLIFDDNFTVPVLILKEKKIEGDLEVSKVLCDIAFKKENDKINDMNENLVKFSLLVLKDKNSLPLNCKVLEEKLTSNYFTSEKLQKADLFIWAALYNNGRWLSLKKDTANFGRVAEWYDRLSKINEFKDAISLCCQKGNFKDSKINKSKIKTQKKKINKNYSSLNIGIDKSMKGKVITRFPPEPSGFLHIGHVKAALLNHTVAKVWEGKMILRFDDTNPSKEKGTYIENIKKDLETLEIEPWKCTHTSDYFGLLIEICRQMILCGRAFLEDTPREIMKKERMQRVNSKNRNNSVEKNMSMWKEMLLGNDKYIVRIKLDMKSPNGTLRDPVLYRVNAETPHLRTGKKYLIYPTYDFSIPIVDTVEGVTNSFRSSEYLDRGEQFKRIWAATFKASSKTDPQSVFLKTIREIQPDALPSNFSENLEAISKCPQMPKVKVFSRLNLSHTTLSKRKLGWFIDTGRVSGWDDPRVPTIQGIVRRGLKVKALRDYILEIGFSTKDNLCGWDRLWSINKRILDDSVQRQTAIVEKDHFVMLIEGAPENPEGITAPVHPKRPELGRKVVRTARRVLIESADAECFVEGEEITLIEWGNVLVEKVDSKNREIKARLNLKGDYKKTMKVTWLADTGADLVRCRLVTLDDLLSVPKIEEGVSIEDVANEGTWREEVAYGDPNLRQLKRGEVLQLQRKGFAIVEKPQLDGKEDSMLLFMIPDSRTIIKKRLPVTRQPPE